MRLGHVYALAQRRDARGGEGAPAQSKYVLELYNFDYLKSFVSNYNIWTDWKSSLKIFPCIV